MFSEERSGKYFNALFKCETDTKQDATFVSVTQFLVNLRIKY